MVEGRLGRRRRERAARRRPPRRRPVAALAVVAPVPLALLVANALAVWPGRQVARLRAAEVLRTE